MLKVLIGLNEGIVYLMEAWYLQSLTMCHAEPKKKLTRIEQRPWGVKFYTYIEEVGNVNENESWAKMLNKEWIFNSLMLILNYSNMYTEKLSETGSYAAFVYLRNLLRDNRNDDKVL